MGIYRIERLNEQLREEIARMILRSEIKDPRVSVHLSINRVEVTKDLSYAKIYVSSFLPDGQIKKGVEGLNSAAGYIQSVIAGKLRIRKFPKFSFFVDTGMKDGFKMIQKLNKLESESKSIESEKLEKTKSDLENQSE